MKKFVISINVVIESESLKSALDKAHELLAEKLDTAEFENSIHSWNYDQKTLNNQSNF